MPTPLFPSLPPVGWSWVSILSVLSFQAPNPHGVWPSTKAVPPAVHPWQPMARGLEPRVAKRGSKRPNQSQHVGRIMNVSFSLWNQYHLYHSISSSEKNPNYTQARRSGKKNKKHHCTLCTPDRRIGGFPRVLFLNSPAAEDMHRGMSVSALWDAQNSTPCLAYGLIGCWRACLASPSSPKRGRIETCIPTHAVLPRNDRKPVEAFMDGQYLHLNSCHVIVGWGYLSQIPKETPPE